MKMRSRLILSLFAASLALGPAFTPAVYAASHVKKDMKKDSMKKDSMKKDSMKKDEMKKDEMKKDKMKK